MSLATENPVAMGVASLPLNKALNGMRLTNKRTDVVLVCVGGELQAHQLILSCKSAYFESMFSNEFKEAITQRVDYSQSENGISVESMNKILEYIYLDSTEGIVNEDLESIKAIHRASHLLELNGLTDLCLKLIKKALDVENYLDIWQTVEIYGSEDDVSDVMFFTLKNLPSLLQRDDHVDLLASPLMNRLVEEIQKQFIPIPDIVLNGIVGWCKHQNISAVSFHDVLLGLNFKNISRKYLSHLIQTDAVISTQTFLKKFLNSQILPNLAEKIETQNLPRQLKIPINFHSGKEIVTLSFRYLFMSCYKQNVNDCLINKKGSIKIVDTCDINNAMFIIDLPFIFGGDVFISIVINSSLYIIGAVPRNQYDCCTSQSFLLYDLQEKRAILQPSLPNAIRSPHICVLNGDIYVIEGGDKETLIQCFVQSQQSWKIIKHLIGKVTDCVNLNSTLYLLVAQPATKQYFLHRLVDDEVKIHCRVPVPAQESMTVQISVPVQASVHHQRSTFGANVNVSMQQQQQQMSIKKNYTVQTRLLCHRNKLYVFKFSNDNAYSLYAVSNADVSEWDVKQLHFSQILKNVQFYLKCYAHLNGGILFYEKYTKKIYFFDDENENGDVVEMMTLNDSMETDVNLEKLHFSKFETLSIL